MAETRNTLAMNVYHDLGQAEEFEATGGSATTVANSFWGDLDNQPSEEKFKNSYIFVVRDAGGAGASPEGKEARITAYDTTTYTLTVATVTDAIAAGDTVMFANTKQFPLFDVFNGINRGLRDLGYVRSFNTSLTSASGQTEYTIPTALQGRPIAEVLIQTNQDSNDNQYSNLRGWKVISDTLIYIPQQTSGYTIGLVGYAIHSDLTAYNSALSVYIPKPLAVAAAKSAILERFIAKRGDNVAQNWRALYQEALNQRSQFMAQLDIWRPKVLRDKLEWGETTKSRIDPTLDASNNG